VVVGEGDILLVCIGYFWCFVEYGLWNMCEFKFGLYLIVLWFVVFCVVVVFGLDGNSDIVLSIIEGVDFLIHVFVIVVMGLYLLDYF